MSARPAVLLLCNYEPHLAQCVSDSIDAIVRAPDLDVRVRSGHGDIPERVDLDRFDAILLHYSTFLTERRHIPPATRARLRSFGGAKLAMLHDEHAHVRATRGALAELGIDVLLSCAPDGTRSFLYDVPELEGLRTIRVATGTITARLAGLVPTSMKERRWDVFYRGRRFPHWLGPSSRDRIEIAEQVGRAASRHGWRTDLSVRESDRLYGDKWLSALMATRCTLVTDSGADMVALDDHDAPRELVEAPTLQRSPRVLEAAAAGCVLAGYEGAWSERLEPWRSFVPIERQDVELAPLADLLRSPDRLAEIAANAREAVMGDPFLQEATLHRVLKDAVHATEKRRRVERTYPDEEWRRLVGDYARSNPDIRARDQRRIAALGLYERTIDALPGSVARPTDALVRRGWRSARAVKRAILSR